MLNRLRFPRLFCDDIKNPVGGADFSQDLFLPLIPALERFCVQKHFQPAICHVGIQFARIRRAFRALSGITDENIHCINPEVQEVL